MSPTTRSTDPTTSSFTTTTPAKPVSILFVCLGNICRSPMAEGAFRQLTHFNTPQQHPLIASIDSCGTGAYHAGSQPDPRSLQVLVDKAGIEVGEYRHKARKVRIPSDFEEFDYILGADEDNVMDLREMVKRASKKGLLDGEAVMKKVQLYGALGGKSEHEEIADPWYDGGSRGFEVAYEQVERMGKGLLRHIEQEAGKK